MVMHPPLPTNEEAFPLKPTRVCEDLTLSCFTTKLVSTVSFFFSSLVGFVGTANSGQQNSKLFTKFETLKRYPVESRVLCRCRRERERDSY